MRYSDRSSLAGGDANAGTAAQATQHAATIEMSRFMKALRVTELPSCGKGVEERWMSCGRTDISGFFRIDSGRIGACALRGCAFDRSFACLAPPSR
jgi:hypothetical protein